MSLEAIILTIITVFGGGGLTLYTSIMSSKSQERQKDADRAIDLIDEYRKRAIEAEERTDRLEEKLTRRIEEQHQQIRNVAIRVSKLEVRERVLMDYAYRLRMHIEKKLGPPPPDWPTSLNMEE